ncbi:related to fungal specific actin related protein-Laccaria bicolor [Serendipita indica DSM 11827]|uniref:Related to fungal specific actin related protein-Laccaria bicolor n=1 Tax=Serendipita indica (strain DSM 11827) TaxID=1109443 RepID=G4TC47_SERID|nr:related to fungal specific actin related protein-Laccaria bicolor [Serendipita indica DSM 11827]
MAAPQAEPRRPTSMSGAGEARPRQSSSSYVVGNAPQYTATRRHSLYGTEDRIIIDPGSRFWKVGFSGEGKPRQVFLVGSRHVGHAHDEAGGGVSQLWQLEGPKTAEEREEADRMLAARLQDALRSVFFESLMTDPKSRKVIIVEHPLLPLRVKDLLAKILFDNLNIPSLSFASSSLLALIAVGRTSGLVVDSGHLETYALPISSSRPMYPLIKTTPRAGARLTQHLRALILEFGTFHPPFATLAGSANTAPRPTRIPPEILTDAIIEDIKTSCCFVGRVMSQSPSGAPDTMGIDTDMPSPRTEDRMSVDPESQPHTPLRSGPNSGTQTPVRQSQAGSSASWATRYQRDSSAVDFLVPVKPPPPLSGTGRGSIRVPGWVRERAAELLFEAGDVDEASVAEVVLQSLLKTPVDLRKDLISTIVVIGGTAMMPGFIPRLHDEIVRTLTKVTPTASVRSPKRRAYDPYEPLRALVDHVAILNDPSPVPSRARTAGSAPAFAPLCMSWVGGSIAGALKTGGQEILHDKWDEASVVIEEPETPLHGLATRENNFVLPDWTRAPLRVGAPHAGVHPPRQYGVPLDEPITV